MVRPIKEVTKVATVRNVGSIVHFRIPSNTYVGIVQIIPIIEVHRTTTMNKCENLIPGLHTPCGENGDFCSESCYHAELMREMWIICAQFNSGFEGPLTSTYRIGRVIDKLRGKLAVQTQPDVNAFPEPTVPAMVDYKWSPYFRSNGHMIRVPIG